MRVTVSINSDKEIMLPIQYNHILQGFLYNNLTNKDYREFLHQSGYKHENRTFKLFTYSRLMGEFKIYQHVGKIAFLPPVSLVVSSPIEQFITDVAETLMKSDFRFLGTNSVYIQSINVHKNIDLGNRVQIKMLSPIVTHTTTMEDGKKKTNYFSPWDTEFNRLINGNLYKKYEIIHGEKPDGEVKVIPVGNGREKFSRIINYKDFYIKGYAGIYWLVGNPNLIKVAYDTGLGSKNSQGFGCWEVVGY